MQNIITYILCFFLSNPFKMSVISKTFSTAVHAYNLYKYTLVEIAQKIFTETGVCNKAGVSTSGTTASRLAGKAGSGLGKQVL